MTSSVLKTFLVRASLAVVIAGAVALSASPLLSPAHAQSGNGAYKQCVATGNPCPTCPGGGGGTQCSSSLPNGVSWGGCTGVATSVYCTSARSQCGAQYTCANPPGLVSNFCNSGLSWDTCQ